MAIVHSELKYEDMFNFRFDFRSEINWFASDNGLILPFFYISGGMSEPEVEHVMFDVQFYDYLRVL